MLDLRKFENFIPALVILWVAASAGDRYDDPFKAFVYTILVAALAFAIYKIAIIVVDAIIARAKKRIEMKNDVAGWYVFMVRERHANIAFGPFKSQAKAEHEIEFSNFIDNYRQEDCLDIWTMWSHGTDIDSDWLKIRYEYTNA